MPSAPACAEDPHATATAPFARKVVNDSPAKRPKWQHCQTSPPAQPPTHGEPLMFMLCCNDVAFCNISQTNPYPSTHFKVQRFWSNIFISNGNSMT